MLPSSFPLQILGKKCKLQGNVSGVGCGRIRFADVRELQVLFRVLPEKHVSLFSHRVFSEVLQCEAVGMEMAFNCVWSDIRLGSPA